MSDNFKPTPLSVAVATLRRGMRARQEANIDPCPKCGSLGACGHVLRTIVHVILDETYDDDDAKVWRTYCGIEVPSDNEGTECEVTIDGGEPKEGRMFIDSPKPVDFVTKEWAHRATCNACKTGAPDRD